MKPIKFLLSLCAVLMVAVGAMGQVSSITAPSGLPASVCGGATVTPSGAPTLVESGCAVQPLELQAINPANNSVIAFGSAGTVGAPTAGSVTLPATFAPASANITFRYAVTTGGPCVTVPANSTLSGLVPFTPNNLPVPTGSGSATVSSTICAGGTATITGLSCPAPAVLTYFTGPNTTDATTTFPGVIATAGTFTYYARCVDGTCIGPPAIAIPITATAAPNPTGSLTITQACGANFPAFSGFTCPAGSTPILINTATGLQFTAVVSGTTYSLAGGCRLDASPNCITAPANVVNTQNYTHLAVPDAPSTPTLNGTGPGSFTVCPEASLNFAASCASGVLKVSTSATPGGTALTNPVTAPTTGSATYYVSCIIVGGTGCEGPASAAFNVTISNAAPTAPAVGNIKINGTTAVASGSPTVTVCPGASLNFSLLPATCASGQMKVSLTSGGPAEINPLTATTTPSTTTTYYVSCYAGPTCESLPTAVDVLTAAMPYTPTPQAVAICSGGTATPTFGAGGCPVGEPVVYFSNADGTGPVTFPGVIPTAGTFTYYAACKNTTTGCVGTLVPFTVTSSAHPKPTGSLTLIPVCSTALPSFVPGTFTCPAGSTPILINTATGLELTGSLTIGTTYSIAGGCKATGAPFVAGCITLPAEVVNTQNYTPQAVPDAPTDPKLNGVGPGSFTVCPGAPLNFSSGCATGVLKVSTSSVAGGTALTNPVTASTTPGTTTYYISCIIVGGTSCEGAASAGFAVTVANVGTPTPTSISINGTPAVLLPAPPSSPNATVTVCPGASLNFAASCVAGQMKVGSSNAAGLGNALINPVTAVATYNTVISYFISCYVGPTCESAPVEVRVLTVVAPTTPTVSPITLCAGATATPVFTTGCIAGETPVYYSNANRTGPVTFPGVIPSSGTFTFYVACKNTTSTCEGPLSSFVITASALPNAPTFTGSTALQPTSACANTNVGLPLNNTLTCSNPSQVLVWYDSNNNIVSTPNTQPAVTTTWTVACRATVASPVCESARTTVTYTVNPLPGNPTSVSLTSGSTTVNAGGNAAICSSLTTNAISFTGCAVGETLLYSINGGTYTNPAVTPATQAASTTVTYRVKCQLGDCLSQMESGAMVLTINALPAGKPTAALTPSTVCATTPLSTPFGGSSSCGAFATVWFDASGDVQLASLPATIPTTAKTYYAKCKSADGCFGEKSDNVTFTIIPNAAAPMITSTGGDEICTGVNVTLSTNCPVGSTVVWSNNFTGTVQSLVSNVPQTIAVSAKCVTTVNGVTCESPVSALKTIVWKAFDLTIINIGSSQSGTKPGSNVPKSAWAANFVTGDAGPSLQNSSQGNPTIFFTENPNKGGPRFWTIHVEACALPTTGSISYDMLATPEVGVPMSFNTVENNAPYLMYANRDNFTELYAQNNPFFGFFADNGSGGNKYDTGLPKGLYKLSIRYWDQKGLGIAPAVRVPQGNQLQYQEYWFRIQSQNGIGTGAGREGVSETSEVEFATVAPNPVTRTLTLAINGAKGQEVKMNLVDAAGRIIKSSTVTPETNTHREEVDMSSQTTGMYFMNISTPTKRANLKVLKVSND